MEGLLSALRAQLRRLNCHNSVLGMSLVNMNNLL